MYNDKLIYNVYIWMLFWNVPWVIWGKDFLDKKSTHWFFHSHLICMGDLGEFFLIIKTPKYHTETHKRILFPYKQVSGRNGDHEWPMLSYYVIYYEKFKKVIQWREKEALMYLSLF